VKRSRVVSLRPSSRVCQMEFVSTKCYIVTMLHIVKTDLMNTAATTQVQYNNIMSYWTRGLACSVISVQEIISVLILISV